MSVIVLSRIGVRARALEAKLEISVADVSVVCIGMSGARVRRAFELVVREVREARGDCIVGIRSVCRGLSDFGINS